MAIHPWQKIPEKAKRKLIKGMQGHGLYWLTKAQRREIGLLAHQLGIPGKRLREHFETLRQKGIPWRELPDAMMHELEQARELAEATEVHPARLKQALEKRSLVSVMQEMEQHFQAMQAMQQRAAAA